MTEVGTEANDESEARFTTAPPLGPIPVSVTMPVELVPPGTEGGKVMSEESRGASTPSFADFVIPVKPAEIVAETFAATALVVTAKVAEEAPAEEAPAAEAVAEEAPAEAAADEAAEG